MSGETSDLSSRFAPQAQPAGSAITRNAEPSREYIIKLAEAQGVLSQAAAQYAGADSSAATVTQASSLGAEDVVISHIINSLKLDIGIFVLETGALHKETLDLLERFKATSRAAVTVYQPVQQSVVQFVAREGKDAMYKSIALAQGLLRYPQDGATGTRAQRQRCVDHRFAPRAKRCPRRCAAGRYQ
jgi:phosphoadenosine phosphosulfate reductase